MTTYKKLLSTDKVSTRTLLHEAIPLTGAIVSGTYGDTNIKNYAHGMFQSVYDYPYLSSSANHIFDVTVGVGAKSGFYSSVTNQKSKKANIYNQMAQVLMGYDVNGSILRFDADGNLTDTADDKLDEVFVVNFARLLSKDEVKKGTFQLELGVNTPYEINRTSQDTFNERLLITDFSGSDGFLVNSPVGEYGVLYATSSTGLKSSTVQLLKDHYGPVRAPVGLLFYQAGIAILSSSVFMTEASGGVLNNHYGAVSMSADDDSAGAFSDFRAVLTGSNIETACDNIRSRIYNIQFNNTVELNSSIYFCRANNNEFNYSSNPTYLKDSQIIVKEKEQDNPVSYITTVGLYNTSRELVAVAKLSEPLKKSPDTEFTIRVRLDY